MATSKLWPVFDPDLPLQTVDKSFAALAPRALIRTILDFYRSRVAWVALAVSAVTLTYLGGLAMFWFHSVYLGEGGPAISPPLHWFVDSTAGFIALTPALALIMPVVAHYTLRARPPDALRLDGFLAARYALAGGVLFALVTGPGPVLHNAFVGRGTWLANHITAWWGDGRPLGPSHHIPAQIDMSLQVAFGIPVYIGLMWLALIATRSLLRLSRARRSS